MELQEFLRTMFPGSEVTKPTLMAKALYRRPTIMACDGIYWGKTGPACRSLGHE